MGLPMGNDLSATTSEQIKEPESKFGTQKNLSSLTFQSRNFMLIDHVICNMTIFLKIFKLTKTGVGLRKEVKQYHFSFHINKFLSLHVWNDSPLHFNKKKLSKNIILMPKFNLELLRTFIKNFWCIHSKRRKKYLRTRYLKRQFIYPNKVKSLQFCYLCSFSISHDHVF